MITKTFLTRCIRQMKTEMHLINASPAESGWVVYYDQTAYDNNFRFSTGYKTAKISAAGKMTCKTDIVYKPYCSIKAAGNYLAVPAWEARAIAINILKWKAGNTEGQPVYDKYWAFVPKTILNLILENTDNELGVIVLDLENKLMKCILPPNMTNDIAKDVGACISLDGNLVLVYCKNKIAIFDNPLH